MQSVHGVMLKQSSQSKYQLWEVKFLRSRVLCIHKLSLKKQELEELYQTKIVKHDSQSHFWNDEDHALEYQLDQWGVEKLFQNSYEVVRELKNYIEEGAN